MGLNKTGLALSALVEGTTDSNSKVISLNSIKSKLKKIRERMKVIYTLYRTQKRRVTCP